MARHSAVVARTTTVKFNHPVQPNHEEGWAHGEGGFLRWVGLCRLRQERRGLGESTTSVTGPSLTSARVHVGAEDAAADINAARVDPITQGIKEGDASSGLSALSDPGLRPFEASPASVKFGTSNTPASCVTHRDSSSPAASGKMQLHDLLRSPVEGPVPVSPSTNPARTMRPQPVARGPRPSTLTGAPEPAG